MTKITILGAGITGMAIAATLPKHYEITLIARNLPGDPDSQDWASPWAGAVWMGMADSSSDDQKMQLEAFAYWWRLALRHPESSVRRIQMLDLMDFIPLEKVWYRYKMPGFRLLTKEEMPTDAPFGVTYGSVVVTPMTFLPWLRERLEKNGVRFLRANVTSLGQLKDMGHDVLINATGIGARYLEDVMDQKVIEVRGQTVLVKSDFDKIWIRRGKDYTYCLPRLDGTAILGGIKQFGQTEKKVDETLRKDIFRRIHEGIPSAFPSPDAADFTVVRDIVGIRPQREGGVRLEKELIEGQKIIHAYGVEGGGYIFSWGLAKEVSRLVFEYELESPEPPSPLSAKL